MSSNYAPQRGQKASGETRLFSVDFGASTGNQTGKLDTGNILTGTPTVTQVSSDPTTATALTLANKTVNGSTVTINGRPCIAGEAVQFTAASGDDAASYVLKVTCGDNGSPAQTLVGFINIDVTDS